MTIEPLPDGGLRARLGPNDLVPQHGSDRVTVRFTASKDFARNILPHPDYLRAFGARLLQGVLDPRNAQEWVEYPARGE